MLDTGLGCGTAASFEKGKITSPTERVGRLFISQGKPYAAIYRRLHVRNNVALIEGCNVDVFDNFCKWGSFNAGEDFLIQELYCICVIASCYSTANANAGWKFKFGIDPKFEPVSCYGSRAI